MIFYDLFNFVFSGCSSDVEYMFSFFMFMFLIISFLSLIKDMGRWNH